ncbi:hypothetical protein ANCDUO_25146, partial [Ancylostoma duodenale]
MQMFMYTNEQSVFLGCHPLFSPHDVKLLRAAVTLLRPWQFTNTAGQQEYSIFPRSCSVDIDGFILVYAIDDKKS